MIDLGQDEEYAVIKYELQGKDMSGIQPFYVDSILYGFYVWGGGDLLQPKVRLKIRVRYSETY